VIKSNNQSNLINNIIYKEINYRGYNKSRIEQALTYRITLMIDNSNDDDNGDRAGA
jgi:hypothetical protein